MSWSPRAASPLPASVPPGPWVVACTSAWFLPQLGLLSEVLKETGQELCLLCNLEQGEPGAAQDWPGPRFSLPFSRRLSPLLDLWVLLRLIFLLLRLRPAVVLSHNPKAGLLVQLAARITGVPCRLHMMHGSLSLGKSGPLRALYRSTELLTLRSAHSILWVSHSLQAQVESSLAYQAPASIVLSAGVRGVDLSYWSFSPELSASRQRLAEQLALRAGDFVLGYAGRFHPEKGLSCLLAAAQQLQALCPEQRILVLLAGREDGVTEAELRRLAGDLQLRILPWQEDLRSFYSLLQVLVLPSLREGLPTVILEAAALSVPVIATRVAGSEELIEAGRTGALVPPGSPEALAEQLLLLLREPQLGVERAARARREVETKYSQDQARAQYQEIFSLLGLESEPRL